MGLSELAALLEFNARRLHPTPPLPHVAHGVGSELRFEEGAVLTVQESTLAAHTCATSFASKLYEVTVVTLDSWTLSRPLIAAPAVETATEWTEF